MLRQDLLDHVGPLNKSHAFPVKAVFISDFIHLADVTDPVHIKMVQRHSSAVILLDDREGRTVYRAP